MQVKLKARTVINVLRVHPIVRLDILEDADVTVTAFSDRSRSLAKESISLRNAVVIGQSSCISIPNDDVDTRRKPHSKETIASVGLVGNNRRAVECHKRENADSDRWCDM